MSSAREILSQLKIKAQASVEEITKNAIFEHVKNGEAFDEFLDWISFPKIMPDYHSAAPSNNHTRQLNSMNAMAVDEHNHNVLDIAALASHTRFVTQCVELGMRPSKDVVESPDLNVNLRAMLRALPYRPPTNPDTGRRIPFFEKLIREFHNKDFKSRDKTPEQCIQEIKIWLLFDSHCVEKLSPSDYQYALEHCPTEVADLLVHGQGMTAQQALDEKLKKDRKPTAIAYSIIELLNTLFFRAFTGINESMELIRKYQSYQKPEQWDDILSIVFNKSLTHSHHPFLNKQEPCNLIHGREICIDLLLDHSSFIFLNGQFERIPSSENASQIREIITKFNLYRADTNATEAILSIANNSINHTYACKCLMFTYLLRMNCDFKAIIEGVSPEDMIHIQSVLIANKALLRYQAMNNSQPANK